MSLTSFFQRVDGIDAHLAKLDKAYNSFEENRATDEFKKLKQTVRNLIQTHGVNKEIATALHKIADGLFKKEPNIQGKTRYQTVLSFVNSCATTSRVILIGRELKENDPKRDPYEKLTRDMVVMWGHIVRTHLNPEQQEYACHHVLVTSHGKSCSAILDEAFNVTKNLGHQHPQQAQHNMPRHG